MRGLAAAVVLVSHVIQIYFLRFIGLDTPLHRVSSLVSEYAVVVFFILSGYLIAHSLEENIERNGGLRLDMFMAARIARLYPPLLYAVLVSIAAFLIMSTFELPGRSGPLRLQGDLYAAREVVHLRIVEIGGALAMVQGMLEINGPLWSLYIEAKLYALYACALAVMIGRRKLVLAVVFLAVAWAGLRFNPGFAGYSAIWLTGALAYYLWNQHAGLRDRLLLCGGAIIFIVVVEGLLALRSGDRVWTTARDVLVAAVIAWLLFRLQVRVPLGQGLASFSYSLYATHFPVLLVAQSLLLSTGSTSVVSAAMVATIGTAAAVAVGVVGGLIEARKSALQRLLLDSAFHVKRAWRAFTP